ncbi:ribonuclease H-like domain-containing protein [Tanacetum coccineum]
MPNPSASPSFTQDDTFMPEPIQPMPTFTQTAFSQLAITSQHTHACTNQPDCQQYPNNDASHKQFATVPTALSLPTMQSFPLSRKLENMRYGLGRWRKIEVEKPSVLHALPEWIKFPIFIIIDDARIGHSYCVKSSAAPTHSALQLEMLVLLKAYIILSAVDRFVPSFLRLLVVSDNEMEEMDLKWQMAMLSLRINRFEKKAGRKMNYNNQQPARFDRRKVRCYKCLQLGHFARECNVKTVDDKARTSFNGHRNSVPCKSKAASVPAGSRNSSASVPADRSDPAASRNRPAVNPADRPHPAGWSKRPATVSAGRPVSAGWLNPAARPLFRPSSVYNTNWSNIYDPMIKGRWGTAVKTSAVYSLEETRPQIWGVILVQYNDMRSSSSNGPLIMERNADYGQKLAKASKTKNMKLRTQLHDMYNSFSCRQQAEIHMFQAEAKFENQDSAGLLALDSADGGNLILLASFSYRILAVGNPSESFPPSVVFEPTDEAILLSVPLFSAEFNPVYADEIQYTSSWSTIGRE